MILIKSKLISIFVLFAFSLSGPIYALDTSDTLNSGEPLFRKSILPETLNEITELSVSNPNGRAASKTITYYVDSSINGFSDYYIYDDGTYEGVLTKSGSPFVLSGSYTPSDTKYVYGTTWHNRDVWEYESFNGYQESPRIYGSDGTVVSNKFNQIGSMGVSYRTSWKWDGSDGVVNLSENYSDSDGYKGTLTVFGTTDNGRYLVDTSTQYWDYPACNKGEPRSKLKVYTRTDKVKLEGYVTKPAVDTRVYRQAYTGTVTNKDKIAPSVKPVTFNWSSSNSVTISVEATDTGGSGLAFIELYDSSNKLLKTSTASPLVYTYTPTVEGITNFYAYAEDNAENRSTTNSNIQVKIDKVNPAATLSPNSKTWTNGNIPVSISVSDSLSGVKSWRYAVSSDNGSSWGAWTTGSGTSGSTTISTEGNSKIKVEVTDNAGNVNTITSGSYQIDKTLPSVQYNPNGRLWNNTDVDVNIILSDAGGSGLNYWAYRSSSDNGLTWGNWSSQQTTLSSTITLSTTGTWIIEVKITDKAGNANVSKSNPYLIDKVNPTARVYTSATTNSRNITIYIDDIVDLNSGIKEVVIGNYENDVKAIVTNISGKSNASIHFELDKKNTAEENYSNRLIYLTLRDNANNIQKYILTTELLPPTPSSPIITNPINDSLFLLNEKISLRWNYTDTVDDFPMSPERFEIIIKDKFSDNIKKYEVNGTARNFNIHDLPKGSYDISVRCYVSETIYSESAPVLVRVGKFKSSGNVKTISILPGTNIKYVAISTKSEIPKGTTILGKIYYKYDSNNVMDRSVSIPFKITSDYQNNILKLPENSAKIEAEYFLRNDSNEDGLSPILDSITVFAK